MLGYALRRLFGVVPTFLLIVAAAFFIMRAAPGGPFDEERTLPPEIEANLQAAYGLDQPVPVQFARYLGGLLRGDLGPSFRMKDFTRRGADRPRPAGDPQHRCGSAGAGACCSAFRSACAAGLRQNGWADHAACRCALAGIAIPNFVVAPVLALVFGL